MDFESFESYDFVFRAVDQDGAMCRYEAVFSFSVSEEGPAYLVYLDEKPDASGEEGTYASILAQPEQAAAAQYAIEHGQTPKKPPVLELRDIATDSEWDLVNLVLDEGLDDD